MIKTGNISPQSLGTMAKQMLVCVVQKRLFCLNFIVASRAVPLRDTRGRSWYFCEQGTRKGLWVGHFHVSHIAPTSCLKERGR